MDYSSRAVECICTIWWVYLLGAYAINVKCKYTRVPCHIVEMI